MKLYEKYIKKVDYIKEKNRLFVYLNSDVTTIKEKTIRNIVESEYDTTFGEVVHNQNNMLVFIANERLEKLRKPSGSKIEKPKMTDLIESYGASELPPAPKEVTDPEPSVEQEKKTTTRRRRNTRRKATKTTETSE